MGKFDVIRPDELDDDSDSQELQSLLDQENREEFLRLVIGNGLHPREAARRVGIPYEAVLMRRKHDAGIDACFIAREKKNDLAKERLKDWRRSTDPAELLHHQVHLAHRLLYEAGLGDKIVEYVASMNPAVGDPLCEGRREFQDFLRGGTMRDLIMSLGASRVEVAKKEENFNDKAAEELEKALEEADAELRRLRSQVGESQATDADYELDGGSGP